MRMLRAKSLTSSFGGIIKEGGYTRTRLPSEIKYVILGETIETLTQSLAPPLRRATLAVNVNDAADRAPTSVSSPGYCREPRKHIRN